MILLLNNQPITLDNKLLLLQQRIDSVVGSDAKSTVETPWLGDDLTEESLFPKWILQAYQDDPSNVTVIPFIKQYKRWLLSLDYGYGAQLDWENLRTPLLAHSVFLEAYANFYFPGADFGSAPLNQVLPNIRRFSVAADANYFNSKGTPTSIKYVICSLLGFNWDDIVVASSSYCTIQIRIATAQITNFEPFKVFLERYVIPAGMIVNYMEL